MSRSGGQGSSGSSAAVSLVDKTADYTLALTDAGVRVQVNAAGAVVVTVPTNASAAFPAGSVVEIARRGAGTVTIAAAGGVTINSPGGLLALANQYSSASLIKVAADVWDLVGDLA